MLRSAGPARLKVLLLGALLRQEAWGRTGRGDSTDGFEGLQGVGSLKGESEMFQRVWFNFIRSYNPRRRLDQGRDPKSGEIQHDKRSAKSHPTIGAKAVNDFTDIFLEHLSGPGFEGHPLILHFVP